MTHRKLTHILLTACGWLKVFRGHGMAMLRIIDRDSSSLTDIIGRKDYKIMLLYEHANAFRSSACLF